MQRTRPRTLNHSLSGPRCPDVQLQAARKVLRWFLLCLYCPLYIVLWSYMTTHVIQHFDVLQYASLTSTNSNSIIFFTTDHFILFIHSSRMFYYFVYSHVHVVGSCPAMLAAGRLPVCLLAAIGAESVGLLMENMCSTGAFLKVWYIDPRRIGVSRRKVVN